MKKKIKKIIKNIKNPETILYNEKVDRITKVHFLLIVFVRISLLVALISALSTQSWDILFITVLAFLFTFLPALFERQYKIDLPVEFEIITVLFIYAALFLGE